MLELVTICSRAARSYTRVHYFLYRMVDGVTDREATPTCNYLCPEFPLSSLSSAVREG